MKRGDFFIIFLVIFIAGGYLLWPKNMEAASAATVSVNGKVVATINLAEDGLYPIQGQPGAGTLEVRDGQIRMQPMEREICPAGICCRITGWIKSASQTIICLPNRIVVNLSQPADYDFVT